MTDTSNIDDTQYAELQRVYLDWHNGRRPLSGFIKELQQYLDRKVVEARIDQMTEDLGGLERPSDEK